MKPKKLVLAIVALALGAAFPIACKKKSADQDDSTLSDPAMPDDGGNGEEPPSE